MDSAHVLAAFHSFSSHGQSNPTICTLEGIITNYIKKWLKLLRSATRAIIYHPSVMNIPSLGSVKVRAKLSLLASLSRSTDPAVMDMDRVLNDTACLQRNDILTKELKICSRLLIADSQQNH